MAEVAKIRSLSEMHLGAEASAKRAAVLGIFAHHADTPSGLRISIEHAMKRPCQVRDLHIDACEHFASVNARAASRGAPTTGNRDYRWSSTPDADR